MSTASTAIIEVNVEDSGETIFAVTDELDALTAFLDMQCAFVAFFATPTDAQRAARTRCRVGIRRASGLTGYCERLHCK
jgi:hypothetical protein